MLIGDPSNCAIESCISIAYEEPGPRALGYFVIHIAGRCYGVREPDATLIGSSFYEIERRLAQRGTHTAPFATEHNADKIANAFRDAIYAPGQENGRFFGVSQSEFSDIFYSRNLMWAPDGDEAFDDGSYVLQFDVEDHVRLISFNSWEEDYRYNPATLSDIQISADRFYGILENWRSAFEVERLTAPKIFKAYAGEHDDLAEIIRLAELSKSLR